LFRLSCPLDGDVVFSTVSALPSLHAFLPAPSKAWRPLLSLFFVVITNSIMSQREEIIAQLYRVFGGDGITESTILHLFDDHDDDVEAVVHALLHIANDDK